MMVALATRYHVLRRHWQHGPFSQVWQKLSSVLMPTQIILPRQPRRTTEALMKAQSTGTSPLTICCCSSLRQIV